LARVPEPSRGGDMKKSDFTLDLREI